MEPIGTPAEVEPTDVAPSLSAAAVLSQSVPEKKEPDRPADVLEEVDEEDDRFEEKDEEDEGEDAEVVEEEERPKRKAKRTEPKYRTPYYAQPPRPEGVTRNRIMGGVGTGMGGMILLGTLAPPRDRVAERLALGRLLRRRVRPGAVRRRAVFPHQGVSASAAQEKGVGSPKRLPTPLCVGGQCPGGFAVLANSAAVNALVVASPNRTAPPFVGASFS